MPVPIIIVVLAYNDGGDYNRAIVDFNTAIQLDPRDAINYYNRGIAYNNKKEYDHAVTDFNTAIGLKPNLAEAYSNRGFAHNA